MNNHADELNEDQDSLHILPLTTVPLQIPSLQQARLIKNVRLESMIELYSGKETGSGQISPGELNKSFDFSGERKTDLTIVRSLCKLASFDVYSLRIELRKLGINVDDHEKLKLSKAMTEQLSGYMHVFTRPLVSAVYGKTSKDTEEHQDLLKLFMSPDKGVAKDNLQKLADMLETPIMEIPVFLQDYGDVYLSLAYYKYCADQDTERMTEFFEWLDTLNSDPAARANREFKKASEAVEKTVRTTAGEVQNILGMFENRTSDMWDEPSAEKFRAMKGMVIEYQTQIGGALCAITVKLDSWAKKFRFKGPGGIQQRIEFMMNEMRYGLDRIKHISYDDAPM